MSDAPEDIFISYKRERRRATEHLAAILRAYGYSVWFDYGLVKGRDFGFQIDAKIRAAKATLVLWCPLAVHSPWVQEEVDLAIELDRLVPAKIVPCTLLVGTRRKDNIDLTAWDAAPNSDQLYPLLDALAAKIGRDPAPNFLALRALHDTWRLHGRLSLAAFVLEASPEPVEQARLPRVLVSGVAHDERVDESLIPVARGERPSANGTFHAADDRLFEEMEKTNTIEGYEFYLKRFPEGRHAAVVEFRLERERRAAAAAAVLAEANRQAEEAERQRLAVLKEEEERRTAHEAADRRQKAEAAAREAEAQKQRGRAEGRVLVRVAHPEGAREVWIKAGGGLDAKESFQESWKDAKTGQVLRAPEMLVVPAGEFWMGSPENEPERESVQKGTESPQHPVTIEKPFAVSRCAVTFDEWDALGLAHKPKDYGWGRGRMPVIGVSWDDIIDLFLPALNTALGLTAATGYRLPSEAEWEYACRAQAKGTQDTTPFWWGSSITPAQANYDDNYVYEGGGTKGQWRQGTLPADYTKENFKPNPWGLHQMHGNVWEWCEDCWHDSYSDAPDDDSAWTTGDCNHRVLRGGSWEFDSPNLRAAYRFRYFYGVWSFNFGFRLARTLFPS